MGIERTISTPNAPLDWPSLLARLTQLGESPILRMIDGLPAFPDEVPAEDWREIRIGLAGGMVTVRRTSEGYSSVTWGTSDTALQKSSDALILAIAKITGGKASS